MTSYDMFFGMIRDSGQVCTIETAGYDLKIRIGDFLYDGSRCSTEEACYYASMAYHRHLGRVEACAQIKQGEQNDQC